MHVSLAHAQIELRLVNFMTLVRIITLSQTMPNMEGEDESNMKLVMSLK